MAIGFNAVTSTTGNVASSLTFSHTPAGTNRLIVVGTYASDATDANRPVTGITFNGVALTKANETDDAPNNFTAGLWYLVAPAASAQNVVVTYTGSCSDIAAFAISLTGVNQTNPLDAATGGLTAAANSASKSITVVTANSWVVDCVLLFGIDLGLSADAGQTERLNGSGVFDRLASTKGPVSTGSVSMGWSGASSSPNWAHSLASFAPVATSSGASGRLLRRIG